MPPNRVHQAIKDGGVPDNRAAVCIAEAGKPLISQAP
jgi:hypothetical protein